MPTTKKPKKRTESRPSGAPRNDGGRSFSTKERLVVNQKSQRKVAVFQEKSAFFTFSGWRSETLCWVPLSTSLPHVALDEVYRFFFSYFFSKGNCHFRILTPNFGNERFNGIFHKFFIVNFIFYRFHDYFMVFFITFMHFDHKHWLTIDRFSFNQCFVRQNITVDTVVFPITSNDETIVIRVWRTYLERSFPLKSIFVISRSYI